MSSAVSGAECKTVTFNHSGVTRTLLVPEEGLKLDASASGSGISDGQGALSLSSRPFVNILPKSSNEGMLAPEMVPGSYMSADHSEVPTNQVQPATQKQQNSYMYYEKVAIGFPQVEGQKRTVNLYLPSPRTLPKSKPKPVMVQPATRHIITSPEINPALRQHIKSTHRKKCYTGKNINITQPVNTIIVPDPVKTVADTTVTSTPLLKHSKTAPQQTLVSFPTQQVNATAQANPVTTQEHATPQLNIPLFVEQLNSSPQATVVEQQKPTGQYTYTPIGNVVSLTTAPTQNLNSSTHPTPVKLVKKVNLQPKPVKLVKKVNLQPKPVKLVKKVNSASQDSAVVDNTPELNPILIHELTKTEQQIPLNVFHGASVSQNVTTLSSSTPVSAPWNNVWRNSKHCEGSENEETILEGIGSQCTVTKPDVTQSQTVPIPLSKTKNYMDVQHENGQGIAGLDSFVNMFKQQNVSTKSLHRALNAETCTSDSVSNTGLKIISVYSLCPEKDKNFQKENTKGEEKQASLQDNIVTLDNDKSPRKRKIKSKNGINDAVCHKSKRGCKIKRLLSEHSYSALKHNKLCTMPVDIKEPKKKNIQHKVKIPKMRSLGLPHNVKIPKMRSPGRPFKTKIKDMSIVLRRINTGGKSSLSLGVIRMLNPGLRLHKRQRKKPKVVGLLNGSKANRPMNRPLKKTLIQHVNEIIQGAIDPQHFSDTDSAPETEEYISKNYNSVSGVYEKSEIEGNQFTVSSHTDTEPGGVRYFFIRKQNTAFLIPKAVDLSDPLKGVLQVFQGHNTKPVYGKKITMGSREIYVNPLDEDLKDDVLEICDQILKFRCVVSENNKIHELESTFQTDDTAEPKECNTVFDEPIYIDSDTETIGYSESDENIDQNIEDDEFVDHITNDSEIKDCNSQVIDSIHNDENVRSDEINNVNAEAVHNNNKDQVDSINDESIEVDETLNIDDTPVNDKNSDFAGINGDSIQDGEINDNNTQVDAVNDETEQANGIDYDDVLVNDINYDNILVEEMTDGTQIKESDTQVDDDDYNNTESINRQFSITDEHIETLKYVLEKQKIELEELISKRKRIGKSLVE